MIVYLANKEKFRDDILSNRIEFNIPQSGHRGDELRLSLAFRSFAYCGAPPRHRA